jgi:molybdopterin-containing oxidoreductase family iron-sulfur binding subunit
MSNNKIYWKGYEELENTPGFQQSRDQEFPESLSVDQLIGDDQLAASATNRRDFLKFLGFGVGAATLAACQTPIKKAIPYVIKPETITPGVANFYASTYYDGHDFSSVLVKTREGRPIKVKGNKHCPLTKGATNARIQGSVIMLYDNKRLKGPLAAGQPTTWTEADKNIQQSLEQIKAANGRIVILTQTLISPSTLAAIASFKEVYPTAEVVQYDSVSFKSIRAAHQATHGKAIIPTYHFDKAESIVSFGADFLNGWLMSGAYETGYAASRNPDRATMSRHFQFETNLSLAGSNADYRTMVNHADLKKSLVALHQYIAQKTGNAGGAKTEGAFMTDVERAADHLLAHKGKGLVVCGINDASCQILVNQINSWLGNYGSTLSTDMALEMFKGDEAAVEQLVKDMGAGKVSALLMYGVNPAYTLPNSASFNEALGKVSLTVSFASRPEETQAAYILPDHHYLESWGDHMPVTGHYTLQQPTINPLFDTRQAQESFLVWSGNATRGDRYNTTWRDYIRQRWANTVLAGAGLNFTSAWQDALHNGMYAGTVASISEGVLESTENVVMDSANVAAQVLAGAVSTNWDVVLYQKVGIGLGDQAANPMLQEFPDPISRVSWDNYIAMAPSDMDELGFNKLMGQEQYAHMATVKVNEVTLTLPVLAQPGQAPKTISIALGYGRPVGRNQDDVVGANAFPLITLQNGFAQIVLSGAEVAGAPGKYQLAGIQTHHTMMGRDIIKETSLTEYQSNPRSGNPAKTMHTNMKDLIPEGGHEAPIDKIDYWQEFKMVNHRWGMSIDLNACTGCGACVVSCHVENNVPVVGKDEIRKSRDMHWLRIDRYYTSDADPSTRYERGNDNHRAKEIPSANPKVAFQPVMCQHCNHAPCETVCPVLATTHSTEGLNQMTYNRCVGTRYCANNCPYKVRRFNWFKYSDNEKFDYYMNDDLGKMVLNPDVTVRARGVMEKCSMCVQRIQAGKLKAKTESRMVLDGEIETACQEACPTNAIVFGDFNDAKGQIPQLAAQGRAYYLLEEVGVKPNIVYQTKVRNVAEAYGHADGGHHGAHAAHDDHAAHDAHEGHTHGADSAAHH